VQFSAWAFPSVRKLDLPEYWRGELAVRNNSTIALFFMSRREDGQIFVHQGDLASNVAVLARRAVRAVPIATIPAILLPFYFDVSSNDDFFVFSMG